MDGQIRTVEPRSEATTDDDAGSSRLRRMVRRAASALKIGRETDANGRVNEFLSFENGDARSREEQALLLNVMKLRDLRVDDVMVPRADIVSVELNASLDDTLAAFREGSHSRLPVYRDTLDDPVGVVHLKDLALSHGFGARANDFSLASHLRSVLVVPPSMRIQALLERMQASRRHMALVIDEYGGVDGLVTIEDIIEQIVGEIDDEHDDAERPLWARQADGAYLAEARALIEDFTDATGLELRPADWEEEVDTLGGLVFMLCGRVPERGEVIPHPLGFEFEIVDADPRRVKRLRIRRSETLPEGEKTETKGAVSVVAEPSAKDAALEPASEDVASGEDAQSDAKSGSGASSDAAA